MTRRILDGVRVLDFSHVLAGPRCSRLLADLGADVLSVERPLAPGAVRPATAPFERIGKRSIALDLKAPEGAAIAGRLAARAGVLVENFAPGVMARLGLGYEQLSEANPRLVYVSISGFGQATSYSGRRAFGAVAHAETGFLWLQQVARGDGAPFAPGFFPADLTAGMNAVAGTLAALYDRERTGRGQHVDVTLMDSLFALMGGEADTLLNMDDPSGWGPFVHPIHASSDGRFFTMTIATPDVARRVAAIIGASEVTPATMNEKVKEWVAAHTGDEVIEAFEREDAPYGAVISLIEALEHPYFAERGMIVEVPAGHGGARRTVRSPYFFSAAEAAPVGGVPAVGEHSRRVLSEELGYSDRQIDGLMASGVVAEADAGADSV